MTTKITIPTAEELTDRLGGLDRLLTAKRWEKAAIVWAFTTDDNGRPTGNRPEAASFPVPLTQFAELGFAGLTKRHTVARYRQAWQDAVWAAANAARRVPARAVRASRRAHRYRADPRDRHTPASQAPSPSPPGCHRAWWRTSNATAMEPTVTPSGTATARSRPASRIVPAIVSTSSNVSMSGHSVRAQASAPAIRSSAPAPAAASAAGSAPPDP